MTPEQLEQQSRDAVIAYLQDSSVRLEVKHKAAGLDSLAWSSKGNYSRFYFDDLYYRIAKPKPWYRVALWSNGKTSNAHSDTDEKEIEATEYFNKWLTDRIEYPDD